MSKDVRFCLDVAESLRQRLEDERFEPEWAAFHPFEQQEDLSDVLREFVEQNLAAVQQLVVFSAPKRLVLMRAKPSREAFFAGSGWPLWGKMGLISRMSLTSFF